MIYWKRPKRRHKKLKGGKQLIGATFQVEKFNNEGNVTYKGPKFNNLVLTVGLDMWHGTTGHRWTLWCNVGTDSTEPAIGQSGLISYLASSNNVIDTLRTYEASAPAHVALRRTYEFAIGSCTGNLVEVGLSSGSNNNYFNRQLFRDQYGDPTTITVLENEGIRVIAEVFVYSDMQSGDVEYGSFLFDGDPYTDFEKRMNIGTSNTGFLTDHSWHRVFNYDYWRQDRPQIWISDNNTPNNFDSSLTSGDRTYESYAPGSFKKVVESVFPAGSFVGDLCKIVTGFERGNGRPRYYEFLLDHPIEVTDVEELTFSMESSWGRWEGGT